MTRAALMNQYIKDGKLIWSSPKIQTQMGAKDALVKIGKLNCGLEDTLAYYSEAELVDGFKKTCAFNPRVIKQNRGSAGEGIWLCWLWDWLRPWPNRATRMWLNCTCGERVATLTVAVGDTNGVTVGEGAKLRGRASTF